MLRKTVMALAPTAGWGDRDGNPTTPEAISQEVIGAVDAGAAVVHLHARDERGALTADLTAFNRTVAMISDARDFILEASTGGLSDLTAQERALPTGHPRAEMGSLNIGSLNFGDAVYRNSLPDVRCWIQIMAARGVRPSLEIFDTGHLEAALSLIGQGLISPPCRFSFIFGVQWGMPFDPALLAYLIGRLPPGSRWGAIFINSTDFGPHLHAARSGAWFIRTGFEDSRRYGRRTAATNVELVAALRQTLEADGFTLATTTEARALLFD